MDKLESSGGKSSCGEMAGALNKQWTMVNEVEMHAEAIQILVKDHKRVLEQLRSQVNNENNLECGNSAFLSDLSCHVEKIRKVINDADKGSLSPTPPSSLLLPYNTYQAEDVAAVVEKALSNSVVLRTIMSNFYTRNLLCCRLVTKSWKDEADIQLLSGHQITTVEFEWNEEEEEYKNGVGTLKEYTECCYGDQQRKFPCTLFRIFLFQSNTDSEETQADLVNFFSKFGHHIKRLYLECSSNSASAYKLIRKIIFEWTPNLQSLSFEYPLVDDEQLTPDVHQMPESKDDGPKVSTVSLKNLQELYLENSTIGEPTVVVETCKHLVGDILSSAPNLNIISDFDLMFTKEIVTSGKIKAVDHLNIWATSITWPLYVEFSEARPQLTSLALNLGKFLQAQSPPGPSSVSAFFSSLQLILESSRLTLKTLDLHHRLHFNPNEINSMEKLAAYQRARFTIPTLKNLEELEVLFEDTFAGGAGWIFPVGFSVQVLFPRLKTLNLQWKKEENYESDRTDNPLNNHFNSSTTVEKLIIHPGTMSFFHLEWIDQARILYPNVRVLNLGIKKSWLELPQICSKIWKSWSESSLEELQISVSDNATHNDSQEGNFAEIMDQAFTGFDLKTCRKLRKKSGSENCEGDEGFKRGSSILDMKKLKLFEGFGYKSRGLPLFSRVSVIHAFDPMRKRQNLKVMIYGAKLENMIQERNVEFSPVDE